MDHRVAQRGQHQVPIHRRSPPCWREVVLAAVNLEDRAQFAPVEVRDVVAPVGQFDPRVLLETGYLRAAEQSGCLRLRCRCCSGRDLDQRPSKQGATAARPCAAAQRRAPQRWPCALAPPRQPALVHHRRGAASARDLLLTAGPRRAPGRAKGRDLGHATSGARRRTPLERTLQDGGARTRIVDGRRAARTPDAVSAAAPDRRAPGPANATAASRRSGHVKTSLVR